MYKRQLFRLACERADERVGWFPPAPWLRVDEAAVYLPDKAVGAKSIEVLTFCMDDLFVFDLESLTAEFLFFFI